MIFSAFAILNFTTTAENGTTFTMCDKATSSKDNLAKNYFNYGNCSNDPSVSIVFGEELSSQIGSINLTNPPSHYMNAFSYIEGFQLINTTHTGDLSLPSYGISMTNPVYFEYYEGT